MGEEFVTKTAGEMTDDEIYQLLTPEDKEVLSMGRKLKKSMVRRKYIKYSIISILILLAIIAIIYYKLHM